MVGLRKGRCYREIERPYTRRSKYKKKNFIKSIPTNKIVKFELGNLKKDFESSADLVARQSVQIRHNSLESVRLLVNRRLHKFLGNNYKLRLRVYPHHILRENKMLTGAGADRMQSGMQKAFGRPIGLAAQVKEQQPIFTVYVDNKDLEFARETLKKAFSRLPCTCKVV